MPVVENTGTKLKPNLCEWVAAITSDSELGLIDDNGRGSGTSFLQSPLEGSGTGTSGGFVVCLLHFLSRAEKPVGHLMFSLVVWKLI
ncbi:hypothetical protein BaRGS_00008088 [Batillaria attramentaria]|uniref:Uncharacterized protein n=1 Tax=Batillaria attramentaria TaxID=370345 RepID=A0ABD0LM16_9CAEN